MTVDQAKHYLLYGPFPGHPHSLEPIRALMAALGNPQERFRCVHVAGTNGKGSACAMTERILRAAGYRTGLYTSPHLQDAAERIRVNGEAAEDAALIRAAERVKAAAAVIDQPLTVFDAVTAAAFLIFAEAEVDAAVLEVGLGGTYDATNVIPVPDCALIMALGLDHTAVLGDTLAQIAGEKAGIIKPGGAVVLYPPEDEAIEDQLAAVCRARGASLRVAEFDELELRGDSLKGQRFCYCDDRPLFLPLLGDHQMRNAAVVLEGIEVLRERGWEISDEAVEQGLAAVRWPARLEQLSKKPCFLLDGGHNPQCAEALAANWAYYCPEGRRVLLLGMMADKDAVGFLAPLAPLADAAVCTSPGGARALSPQALAAYWEPYEKPCFCCETPGEAAETAQKLAGKTGSVLACGSLYLAGALRDHFGLDWRSL